MKGKYTNTHAQLRTARLTQKTITDRGSAQFVRALNLRENREKFEDPSIQPRTTSHELTRYTNQAENAENQRD